MKKIILFVILFTALRSFAQEPKFETLKLTSAPAYTILGVDPQNIQRPATPADFIAGAQSALVNGKLQPNFAIESTPYYWKHPKDDTASKRISLYQFLGHRNNFFENIARTFTFSFATSESDTVVFGDFDPGLGFGVGFKCNLFNGNISRKTMVQISALIESKLIYNIYTVIKDQLDVNDEANVDEIIKRWRIDKKNKLAGREALADYVIDFVKKELGKVRLTADDINFLQKKMDALNQLETDNLAELNNAVFPLSREGFMLELAVGNAAVIQNNQWKELKNAKTAIWLTPSYRINTRKDPTVIDYLDFMGVIRMIWNNSAVDMSDYFDAGFKLQYTHNRFSLSGEYIARMLTEKPVSVESKWTNRLDLSFDYKLNSFVTFKATFGRNFDGNSVHYSDPGKMFAVGGINFGFGDLLKMANQ
jgi:hypothetical protein